jgi:hypothetical protein
MELDNDQAVKSLQDAIDKIDFDGGPDPVGIEPTSTPDPKDAPVLEDDDDSTLDSDEPADDTVADDAEPEEDDDDSTQDESEDGTDDKPALIDSHYRAAQRMGMKPEEISELYDMSPKLAEKTLAKCYEMVNAESARLGKLGIAAQKAEQTRQAAPSPQPQQQPADDRVSRLIAKVKDHYGDDDPMAEVLTELLKDRRSDPQPQAQPQQQYQAIPQRTVDEEIAARQQINTFFADPELTAYEDLYGKNESVLGDWSHLTPGQKANRMEVCNRAQMILYGAAAAGVEMGTAEALERAHMEIAAPMAEQIVRTRLAKSAQKREKGVTLKPGGKRSPQSGGNYDPKQAVEEVGAKMKEIFG